MTRKEKNYSYDSCVCVRGNENSPEKQQCIQIYDQSTNDGKFSINSFNEKKKFSRTHYIHTHIKYEISSSNNNHR